jgi:hypothetical protein
VNVRAPILCLLVALLPAAIFAHDTAGNQVSWSQPDAFPESGRAFFTAQRHSDLRRGSTQVTILFPQPTFAEAEPLVTFYLPPEITETPTTATDQVIPLYDLWVMVLRDQPPPRRANEFLPKIKKIFAEEGVPEELAWLPEIESTFNPRAYNSNGARGLFQFMPLTARENGLRLRPHDERIHPEKSARAAAMLLRRLHGVFDSWPLALAAYNAGEGRVRRTLEACDATTFAEIADALPPETRLYVPRVLATLTVREGIAPSALGMVSQIQ